MKDLFGEIWGSIRRNKLRTCLTGFAVAWGIFMLIVLLGAWNGLMNAFDEGRGDVLTNTMMVGAGWTSKPYDGLKQGRQILFDERDVKLTEGKLFRDHIDEVSATISQSGLTLAYGDRHISVQLTGTFPGHAKMNMVRILEGRFINSNDIEGRRKVVVLPSTHLETLMGAKVSNKKAVGRYVRINDIPYRIIGVYKADSNEMENSVYTSYTTLRTIYSKGTTIDEITFSFHGLENEEQSDEFEKQYRAVINQSHRAAPDDNGAMWIWNRFKQNLQMNTASRILTIALWIVGLFTLMSGIVGVSNIMLITVKERTHEFGIRKAIGATPFSITRLIITESVTITAFFGYIGMALGMFACELMNMTIGQSKSEIFGQQMSFFKNPSVGLDIALEATLLLVIAGTVAGLFPAVKAAKVRPIEALRAE